MASGFLTDKEVHMKSVNKRILVASLLAGLGFAAFSQMPPEGMGGEHHFGMMQRGHGDPAKMQAHMEKRAAALKEKLKLTAEQEGAWTTFTAAMKPSADMTQRMADRGEMAKLTTPDRIDKMKAMHTQLGAEMDKRGEAIKAFYAVLSPEQKKVFDAQHMRGGRHRGMRSGPGGPEAHAPMTKP
jgi:protein CpxP